MAIDALLDLSGKVAVVTGASGGLGSAIAVRLAEAGAAVVVHYNTNADGAAAVVAAIEGAGGKALSVQADVTNADDVEALFDVVTSKFDQESGVIDILVNNAGTYPVSGLLDMSADDWDGVIASCMRSTFLCTQAAARIMRTNGIKGERKAIINIASIAADMAVPGSSHYTAAKAGVIAFTRASALELGAHNIRVNAVSPGLIWRESLKDDWPEGVAAWESKAPLGEVGQPDDIANAVLYLASPASRWVTGANLVVDGGMLVAAPL